MARLRCPARKYAASAEWPQEDCRPISENITGIVCDREEAAGIRLNSFRRQKPATHAKYKDAIEACGSMEYIRMNISQIAREFGLGAANLSRQLRTHYPELIEFRECERVRLGLNDNLPRGSCRFCKKTVCPSCRTVERWPVYHRTGGGRLVRCPYSGLNGCSLRDFLKRHHPELVEQRRKQQWTVTDDIEKQSFLKWCCR